MAITRVNKLGTVNNTATGITSLTLTVGATTTAHNRIIVAAFWGSLDRTATVTDSQGNNYTTDLHGTATGASGWGTIFSSRADNVLTGATDTITLTWGNTVNDGILFAYEYSGLANFAPIDVTTSATASGSSANTGSMTTTKANELIFGLFGWGSNTGGTLPTQTQLDLVHGGTHSLETQEEIVAATGSYSMGLTMAGSQNWLAMAVGYADTANGTANQPSNSTAPAITGSGVVGMQLTCSQGSWTNTPTAYAYQWKRAGVNITGATGAHYLVTTTDVANALSCAVTATNKYGSTVATASNTVTPTVKSIATGLGI